MRDADGVWTCFRGRLSPVSCQLSAVTYELKILWTAYTTGLLLRTFPTNREGVNGETGDRETPQDGQFLSADDTACDLGDELILLLDRKRQLKGNRYMNPS